MCAVQVCSSYASVCVCVCVRSGFSLPAQRSLLKKALGVMAGRLKEGGAELGLEQLVK